MSLHKPLLPECFLHWTDPPNAQGEDVFRIASWRRNLTLKGTSLRRFDQEVLPLLDGSLTVDALCERAADVFARDDLIAALDMLTAQGILIEGDGDVSNDTPEGLTPQLNWLAESAPNGRAAQRKLSRAHVVLFGCGAHGAAAARALTAAGVGQLALVDPADVTASDCYFSALFDRDTIGKNRADALAAALSDTPGDTVLTAHSARPKDAQAVRPLIADAMLVLCCLDTGELSLALAVNEACRQGAVNWIAASLEGTELLIGPGFFHTADGPCYMCWRVREIAGATNLQTRLSMEAHLEQTQSDLSARREALAPFADIAGGMLSAEALSILTGTSPTQLDGRFLVIGVPGLRIEKHTVLRKPGCPVCGQGAAP